MQYYQRAPRMHQIHRFSARIRRKHSRSLPTRPLAECLHCLWLLDDQEEADLHTSHVADPTGALQVPIHLLHSSRDNHSRFRGQLQARREVSLNSGFESQLQLYEKMGCNFEGDSQAHTEYRRIWQPSRKALMNDIEKRQQPANG
jgi:hypothetical protein